MFSKRNSDYFDHIRWTWNLYQRPPCVQVNMESKAWRRTKRAHRSKQSCWQVCALCWKRWKYCWTFEERSVGKICKDCLLFPSKWQLLELFCQSIRQKMQFEGWRRVASPLLFEGWRRVASPLLFEGWRRVASPLLFVFNWTKELCRSFKTRTTKNKWIIRSEFLVTFFHFTKSPNNTEFFT